MEYSYGTKAMGSIACHSYKDIHRNERPASAACKRQRYFQITDILRRFQVGSECRAFSGGNKK